MSFQFNWRAFVIGISFLLYLVTLRVLVSFFLSVTNVLTLLCLACAEIVFSMCMRQQPYSQHTLLLSCHLFQEAIAISRTFASIRGYDIDGNKEVCGPLNLSQAFARRSPKSELGQRTLATVPFLQYCTFPSLPSHCSRAWGAANVASSFTSGYTATGEVSCSDGVLVRILQWGHSSTMTVF